MTTGFFTFLGRLLLFCSLLDIGRSYAAIRMCAEQFCTRGLDFDRRTLSTTRTIAISTQVAGCQGAHGGFNAGCVPHVPVIFHL